jgi:hypothetical protein
MARTLRRRRSLYRPAFGARWTAHVVAREGLLLQPLFRDFAGFSSEHRVTIRFNWQLGRGASGRARP